MSKTSNIGATADEKFALLIKSKKMLRDLEEKIEADLGKGRGKFSLRILEALTKAKQVQLENFAEMVLGSVSGSGNKNLELPVPVWKKIVIGGKSTRDLRFSIIRDFGLGDDASLLMDSPEFQNPEITEEVSFAKGTPRDFGFTGTTFVGWQNFLNKNPFYEMCISGDAVYLREKYINQPKGEWVRCAMKAISDHDGDPCIFYLCHADNMLLVSGRHNSARELDPDERWIVRVRKGILVS